jgi:uncharacterized membrane protein
MRAKDYRDIARDKLHGNWQTAIIMGLIAWFLGGLIVSVAVSGSITVDGKRYSLPSVQGWLINLLHISVILSIVQFVIGGVVRQGYATYLLKQYDGCVTDIKDLFSQFHRFSDGFCLKLLEGIFVILWSLLLLIPGLIASLSYSMAPFIMAENENMTASEALTASKELMDGHKWELFCLSFSFIGWEILSGFTFGIGALFLIPYMNAAYAAFYRYISHS